jgi:hypothetical protein
VKRNVVGAVALLVGEIYLYLRYASLDGQFHYWLHGLLGWGLGLVLLAGLRLRGRHSAYRTWLTPWEAVGLGHLYAAFPDILFLTGGLLHVRWMDVFALHITVHFIPAPVVTVLVVFLLATLGYAFAISRRRRAAAGSVVVAGGAFAVAVGLAAPLPSSIDELRHDPRLALHSDHHHSSEAQAR